MPSDAPLLPDAAAALREAAQRLGVALSGVQIQQLQDYAAQLERWNRVYNLTAIRDPREMQVQHLHDCLAVVAPLRREVAARWGDAAAVAVLDVGSGGGLPGVVLALAEPAWTVTCVDTVAKKAMFVRQVAATLGLPQLRAEHARVETLAPRPWQVITSRAFASLADFVVLTAGQLAPDGLWMAMKGRVPDDEIAALPPDVEVFHVEHLNVPGLDAQRCIVWMRRRAG